MIKKHTKLFFIGIFVLIFIVSLICFFNKSFLLTTLASEKNNNLEVTFLDVGQGDAILIETPLGQNILIDGGEDEKIIKSLSEELPWWDRKIDLMILTHPHSDHVGGLVDVLKRYDVLKVLYTGVSHNSPDYLAWLELIKEKNINLNIIDHPQKVLLGDDCILEIIYPKRQEDVDRQTNLNNTSIVIKLIYGQTSFLFMGDAEREVEKILLESENKPCKKTLSSCGKLKADVIKIGHHGSDTSSAEDFLRIVNPDYAVIEVGVDNSFGHPSLRIIKRLERRDIEIFRTDMDGSIKFVSDGVDLELVR